MRHARSPTAVHKAKLKRDKFAVQRQYQPNFLYRAVASGDVDVISAFSSDGRIAQYDLKILADPKAAAAALDAAATIDL